MAEIVCGPIEGPGIAREIPFVCSLFSSGEVTGMYGVGCNTDNLWTEVRIPAPNLPGWIQRSVQARIYEPGECDLIISNQDRLTVRLCHEADIHVRTRDAAIIRECVERWLMLGYRILASDDTSLARRSWREVRSVADAPGIA